MKAKLLLSTLAATVLLSTAAVASEPAQNLCELYTRDLKQAMMLAGPMNPGYEAAEWALIASRTDCLQDRQMDGVATLIAGFEAMGLPVPTYN